MEDKKKGINKHYQNSRRCPFARHAPLSQVTADTCDVSKRSTPSKSHPIVSGKISCGRWCLKRYRTSNRHPLGSTGVSNDF
ncbi:hypothetical protein CEXT_731981 [Caerostris extrusa]|uniref:Uncharacterized protein n=1 Tax=Caerostris extrusa TaxID=172846 RepID=A0AAV4V659_CAEEX|nr:hypothetical protein CEXT_731981 [Caerostris extrusa]